MLSLMLVAGAACTAPPPADFCEVTTQVFDRDVKGMFGVAAADLNGDEAPDLLFNNHMLKPVNLWINDGGTFSDLGARAGIRETPWVSAIQEPPLFAPTDVGYFIWHDAEFKWRWKIRWVGGGERHDFAGRICPAVSEYRGPAVGEPIVVGKGLTARLDDRRCTVFEAVSGDGVQGLDLLVRPVENGLSFDLSIDGSPRPDLVFVGGAKDRPPASPFLLWMSDRHGCAFGDFDNDGRPDLFVTRGALQGVLKPPAPGKYDELYRGRGDGTLESVTLAAGLVPNHIRGRGAVWADIDGDSLLDLTLGAVDDKLYFYRNADGARLEEMTIADLADNTCALANWADMDADSDPDLLLAGCWKGGGDGLLLNEGGLRFRDVSEASGLRRTAPFSGRVARDDGDEALFRGAMIFPADFDADGDLDLLVSSPDESRGCRLLRNGGSLRFEDVTVDAGLPGDGPWHEARWADYDADGHLDLLLLSGLRGTMTRLYRNNGDGTFTDRTNPEGLNLDRCLSAVFLDYNGDGFLDLAAAGESARDRIFLCPGERNVPPVYHRHLWERAKYWLAERRHPRPWISDLEAQLPVYKHLFKNRGSGNHWLLVTLVGTRSNRDGLGARVAVEAGGRRQVREAGAFEKGRYSQSRLPVHFGLGTAERVERLEIRWPSGAVQVLEDLPADRRIEAREPS